MRDTAHHLRPLRPHQATALAQLRQSLASGHRRPLLQAPTGAGKTVIAAHIVNGALAKGKRIVFTVPALSLVDQTFERFVENGIEPADMGVIQADHAWRRPQAPVQIATTQTLARRDRPETDFVVIDEAHRRQKAIESWMADEPEKIFIGLSATPWTKGLGQFYDDLLKPTSVRELIDAGHLSRFRVFAPSHPDLSGVRTKAGDYHEDDLAEVMSETGLVADVVQTWLMHRERSKEHGSDDQERRSSYFGTLCFAVNRNHARALRDRFDGVGVSVAYIDANTPREERDAIGSALMAGEVEVVVNIGTLTTGVDWDVRCLILARPTKSEMLFCQIIGRALRTADGKEHAVILDHSDTHLRLGMVTDIDFDELDDGRPKKAATAKRKRDLPLPTECVACTALIPVHEPECPSCGAPKPKPQFREADGSLVEMTPHTSDGPVTVREMIAGMGKQRVYSMLVAICMARGYQPGWAKRQYREIFGDWPKRMRFEPIEPNPMIRSWVRSQMIRFAKSRQAEVA